MVTELTDASTVDLESFAHLTAFLIQVSIEINVIFYWLTSE